MAEAQAIKPTWEPYRLRTETLRRVRCATCGHQATARPDLEALAIAHVRETGHTATVERIEIQGWAGLATVPAQSERAGNETPAG